MIDRKSAIYIENNQVLSGTKTSQDNDTTNLTNMKYAENNIELLWSIE